MRGYKVFDPEWKCRGFQYEVGKEYTMSKKPKCCSIGFHFCLKLNDCFEYYSFDTNNKVAEIEAFGDIDCNDEDTKACTNGIRIVRELTWHEVLELVNVGNGCSGRENSGNRNSGNRNSGNCNSGNCNSGSRNSGNCNSWNCNSGSRNSGNCNSGNRNSGDCNSGNWNSGDWNSGNRNSGDCNSGNRNSGDCNSGNWNSGNWNSGNCNSGDWNHTNFSAGVFNTEEQKISMFNKESDWIYRDWLNCRARHILMNVPNVVVDWVRESDMTGDEKKAHPDYKTTRGYLKVQDKRDTITDWWNGLSTEDKSEVKLLPNFDWDIFCECTGIDKERANA